MESTGFAFPFSFSLGEAAINTDMDNIRQSVYLILSTTKGERPMCPEFGTRLADYAFEPITPTLLEMIRREIVSTLLRWEPRIESLEVAFLPQGSEGALHVRVSYHVVAASLPDSAEIVLPTA